MDKNRMTPKSRQLAKKKTRTQNVHVCDVCVFLILFNSGVGKRINNQWHCNRGCDGPFLCVILPGLQSLVIHTLTYLGVAGMVFCIVIKVLSWLEEGEIIWAGLGLPDSVGWKPWRREISIEEFCWGTPASVVLEHVLPDICPATGDLPSRPLEPPTPVSCSESLDTHLLLVLLLCLSPDNRGPRLMPKNHEALSYTESLLLNKPAQHISFLCFMNHSKIVGKNRRL